MNDRGASPLFIDTGAFYARADEDDTHHRETRRLFDGIRSGTVPYRPLYTSQAVVAEFATLALYELGHTVAMRALGSIRSSSSINVIPVGRPAFESAAAQFEVYEDQTISFVDHTTAVIADERGVDDVFAFDSDFRTLGFSLVPDDVSLPHG